MIGLGCQTIEPVSQKQKEVSLSAREPFAEILATDLSFDIEKGTVGYTLPEPAWVRLRIGIQNGGALLRTLMDWEFRNKGKYVEKWDWKNSSGQVNFGARDDLMVILSCRATGGNKSKHPPENVRVFRHSPVFTVSFPESLGETEKGVSMVKGITPMRVVLDENDKRWLTETRFEMAIYLDTIFLAEEEEGVNPYTYQLNTRGFSDGEHALTINVIGYEGQVGTMSQLIHVKNQ